MEFTLNEEFLNRLGFAPLPVDAKNKLLATIYELLEFRVGSVLAESMSAHELDQFERFIDADDQTGALVWLEKHRPDYRDVVRHEIAAIEVEMHASHEAILAAAGVAPGHPGESG